MFKQQISVLFSLLFLITATNLLANDERFNVTDLQNVEVSDESDDVVIEQLKILARNFDNPVATRELATGIIDLVVDGNSIAEYDYLWVFFTLLRNSDPDLDGGLVEQDYISIADIALDYLDSHGVGDWVYTDQGQFKMEVYRSAGNGAAWVLRNSDPEKALYYIEQALNYGGGELYLQDTYVRILLNLDRQDEAYIIVKDVLAEDQDFVDFQDFLTNDDYLSWLKQANS